MNTLDRYIARLYLINVVTLLVLLFSFVVAVDVALNLDRFIDRASELSGGEGGSTFRRSLITVMLVFDLWWPRLLQLFNFMAGLILVGGMGFTFAQMVRHREFVAMLAGGMSLRRTARPVLVVAIGVMCVQVMNQEVLLPRVAHLLTRDHGDAGTRTFRAFDVSLKSDSIGRVFLAGHFDPDEETIDDLQVWFRDDGQAQWRLNAERATWRDGGWDLDNARTLKVAPDRMITIDQPSASRIESDLDPTALLMRQYEGLGQNLSSTQLLAMRSSPLQGREAKEGLDRILFGRISIILSNLLALVIAMPFFLMREPKNMVIQTLKCAPVAIGALMGGILGSAAPIPAIPPGIGVFSPVVALLPVAIATASSIKT